MFIDIDKAYSYNEKGIYIQPYFEKIIDNENTTKTDTLILESRIKDCSKCVSCGYISQIIEHNLGKGPITAELMVIKSGNVTKSIIEDNIKLFSDNKLTMILKSLGLERKDVYITDAIKCQAKITVDKNKAGMGMQCLGYLLEEVFLVKPKVILCLGHDVKDILFQGIDKHEKFSDIRGNWFKFFGYDTMISFSPAYLVRQKNDTNKDMFINDIENVANKLKLNFNKSILHKCF